MPASIHALRISKYGLPLIILLVQQNRVIEDWREAFVVWPEPPKGNSDGVASILRLGIKPRAYDANSLSEAREIRELALREAIMQFAAKEADECRHPADSFELADVERKRLQTWRSLGYFPGLQKYEILSAQPILTLLSELEEPVYFER